MTVPKEVKDWLQHPEDYQFEVKGTGIVAFPKNIVKRMRCCNRF